MVLLSRGLPMPTSWATALPDVHRREVFRVLVARVSPYDSPTNRPGHWLILMVSAVTSAADDTEGETLTNDLTPFGGGDRLPRRVNKQLDSVAHGALIAAARVQGTTFVARVTDAEIAALTHFEAALAMNSPICAMRLHAIGNAATATCIGHIASMSFR